LLSLIIVSVVAYHLPTYEEFSTQLCQTPFIIIIIITNVYVSMSIQSPPSFTFKC